jgi:hypothetical protein
MSHLNESTLGQLLSRDISPRDKARIQHHIERCRACARRLEEWRDNFQQVDEVLPEVPHLEVPSTTLTPGGVVVVPAEAGEDVREGSIARALWIAVAVMVVVVAYAAGGARRGVPVSGGYASAREFPSVRAEEGTENPGPVSLAANGNQRPGARPTDPPRGQRSADPLSPTRGSSESQLSVSPGFSRVGLAEAVRRLGGPIRTISGLQPDHLEAASAKAVPGALKGLDVVRLVYQAPEGGRIMVDLQRIPADSNGLRPIDDPALESGETKFSTGPGGSHVATWLDDQGYRISVTARLPEDSLRGWVQRIQ